MTINGKAFIVGAFEHPLRHAPDKSLAQLQAEVAHGALEDAGLSFADVDGFFCDSDAPGLGPLSMAEYLGLKLRHYDSTDVGGSAPMVHVGHAALAIAAGKCNVALITLAAKPRTGARDAEYYLTTELPESAFEFPFGYGVLNQYAMAAMRHMYDYRTTSEDMAWVKVAASHHAQHNPQAMLRDVVSVEDILSSPLVADPLHRLDCCVVSDSGGAVIVTRPEIARSLGRPGVKIRGAGEALQGRDGGTSPITSTASVRSGKAAFSEAGIAPADVKYASIYDSFTISVIIQLEDLGFCEKGQGGRFVRDGGLISGVGRLPVNTDGGGLCNNHPGRGGITKIIEAVRQLRGEANPPVQVSNCDIAVAHGTGGWYSSRHGSATLVLERI